METRTGRTKIEGFGFCPSCEPERWEAYQNENDLMGHGTFGARYGKSLCKRHGRFIKNIHAIAKENAEQDTEE